MTLLPVPSWLFRTIIGVVGNEVAGYLSVCPASYHPVDSKPHETGDRSSAVGIQHGVQYHRHLNNLPNKVLLDTALKKTFATLCRLPLSRNELA